MAQAREPERVNMMMDRLLYSAEPYAKESLFYLYEIGRLTAEKTYKHMQLNRPAYMFAMVLEGEGELFYDGRVYPVREKTCVFLDARKLSEYATQGQWTMCWICFDNPRMAYIVDKLRESGVLPVYQSTHDYYGLWNQIRTAADQEDAAKDMRIHMLLSKLLLVIMEEGRAHKRSNEMEHPRMKEIKLYINENYMKPISLASLAQELYFDKSYLAKCFKKSYGITVGDYITSVRLDAAKRLLTTSNGTLDEISNQVGINGASYFSRIFSRAEGMTPTQYRSLFGNNNLDSVKGKAAVRGYDVPESAISRHKK